jgi:hypothetical protein
MIKQGRTPFDASLLLVSKGGGAERVSAGFGNGMFPKVDLTRSQSKLLALGFVFFFLHRRANHLL